MIRHYRIVKMRDPEGERWAVVAISLRADDTWDVINEFAFKADAEAYVRKVQAKQAALS